MGGCCYPSVTVGPSFEISRSTLFPGFGDLSIGCEHEDFLIAMFLASYCELLCPGRTAGTKSSGSAAQQPGEACCYRDTLSYCHTPLSLSLQIL